MTCPRCHGLLLPERLAWMPELIEQVACVNCACRLDATILDNRRHPPILRDPAPGCEEDTR